MSKPKHIHEEYKLLPSIKKSPKSTVSSPKQFFKKSISPYTALQATQDFKQSSMSLSPDEFHHHKLDDQIYINRKPKRKDQSSYSKIHIEIPQLVNLDQDSVRKNVDEDSRNGNPKDYMQDTISSNHKKNILLKNEEFVEFRRESLNRIKNKDYEIQDARRKSEEFTHQLQILLNENIEAKNRNKLLEEELNKTQNIITEMEKNISQYQASLKKSAENISEKQNEVMFKQSEVEEISELFRRSEEKRKIAIEYNNSLESSISNLQKQFLTFKKKSEDLQKELDLKNSMVEEKDFHLKTLQEKASKLEEIFHLDKEKLSLTKLELEKTKSDHQDLLLNANRQISKLEEQNSKLQNQLKDIKESSQIPTITFFKRSESLKEQKNIDEIDKNEVTRWHSRYHAAEQELLQAKEQLEKSNKNENYLKTQMCEKNHIIKQMEGMILSTENYSRSLESSPNPNPHKSFNELYHLSEIMLERIKCIEDFLRCETCFKISQKNYVCFPCGHICCDTCNDALEEICGKCASRVTGVTFTELIYKVLNSIRYLEDDLKSVRKFMDFPSF
ncbi:hypothetical protein SteCoe_16997 [Stentor coeruleus]|uniref:RING-type domain-containing protein n=1 Tax=Stentor coeruleus TaxID=5963 RepID=A0A1R2C010_9CILI|nr:hypothetical protein SteCoe_16997 [Stentor coeruleus]